MSDQDDVQTAMSNANDAEKSLDQMKTFMELRGLQPNTVYPFAFCARKFLAHAGKTPTAIDPLPPDRSWFWIPFRLRRASPATGADTRRQEWTGSVPHS
jgi:hypothetical protein